MLNSLCWLGWIVGTVLIVLSWTETVSTETGWVGFGVALAGSLTSRVAAIGGQGLAHRHEPDPQDEYFHDAE